MALAGSEIGNSLLFFQDIMLLINAQCSPSNTFNDLFLTASTILILWGMCVHGNVAKSYVYLTIPCSSYFATSLVIFLILLSLFILFQ